MFRKFPDTLDSEVDLRDLASGGKPDMATEFILFLVGSYLEDNIAKHKITVLFNPEKNSPGSGQMLYINIEIDDNFS